MTPILNLSGRLEAAAQFCSDGSVADIGTDHALLPIKLVLDGHSSAVACDICEGPCERARANVERFGLREKINVFCRPGLENIEEFAPDNIFICGMGGEMTASILAESNYPKTSRCRLILQPQSMQDVLRAYLSENGFSIISERVIYDGGKYYQILAAKYTGEKYLLTYPELRLGKLNLERAEKYLSDVDRGWLEFVLRSAERRVEGRKKAISSSDVTNDPDSELISTIKGILEEEKYADS